MTEFFVALGALVLSTVLRESAQTMKIPPSGKQPLCRTDVRKTEKNSAPHAKFRLLVIGLTLPNLRSRSGSDF